MESTMLQVGVTNVNIQRTDGRVHSARVTSVSEANKMVMVEWIERGETKGKEIDFDAIFDLNPELFEEKTKEPLKSKMTFDCKSNLKPEFCVHKLVEPLKSKNDAEEKMQTESVDEVNSSFLKKNENNCLKKSRLVPPRKKASSSTGGSMLPKIPAIAALQRATSSTQSTGQMSSPKMSRPSVAPLPTVDRLRVSPRYSRRSVALPACASGTAIVTVPSAVTKQDSLPVKSSTSKKKLSCFKAVEKIAKQRHERRITQQALRIQREQAYDTSVPNWEFDAMIREFRGTLDYCPLSNSDAVADHRICVCVRKRPQNMRELSTKEIDVITIPSKDLLLVHEPKTKVDLTRFLENHKFRFDYAFDENSTNEMVYRYTAKPLVESIFNNGMATCFAYGQTGSGKTHTMGGEFSTKAQQDCSNGIYFLAARDVFHLLDTKFKRLNLTASASYFEIYSGKVFDLLNGKAKLRILEDGRQQVQIVNLKEEVINDTADVSRLIQTGSAVRTSGVTSANSHSSRSHAVFQIILRARSTKKLHGKFSLVDLAGNERGADTFSSDRQTRTEGAEINKSLLALKECIRALGKDGSYVPFRLSRLTHVLRDSFVGAKSRTCMIAMISPCLNSCEHTLNTLRYADRVKELGASGSQAPENKAMEVEDTEADENELQMTNDDFDLLQSGAEQVSQELLNFHNIVGVTQEQEEELIDNHCNLLEHMATWHDSHQRLLKATETIDYDVVDYTSELDRLLTNEISSLTAMKAKVEQLKRELADEENLMINLRMTNNQSN